jgi:hypothetical protein
MASAAIAAGFAGANELRLGVRELGAMVGVELDGVQVGDLAARVDDAVAGAGKGSCAGWDHQHGDVLPLAHGEQVFKLSACPSGAAELHAECGFGHGIAGRVRPRTLCRHRYDDEVRALVVAPRPACSPS